MSRRLKLECSHEQFHALHVAVDGARENSRIVKVEKAILAALLRDHGKLVGEFQSELEGVL